MSRLVVLTRDLMDGGRIRAEIPDAVVAYGPHVDDAALAAGCRDALPRSVVFRRLSDLLD